MSDRMSDRKSISAKSAALAEIAASMPASPAEAIQAMRSGVALGLEPAWLPIRIAGRDAADYLHRRLTKSVRSMKPGAGAHALQLSGEGRMQCDLLVYRSGESEFVALAEESQAEAAFAIIDKYVLMDNVEVKRDWEYRIAAILIGPKATEVIGELCEASEAEMESRGPWLCTKVGGEESMIEVFRDGRWMVPCFHLSLHRGDRNGLERLKTALIKAGAKSAPIEAVEYFRIEQGVPRFGADTTERTIPLESNLRDALDLDKGCFPGQEFLARINNLGHPARVLARLTCDPSAAVAPGDRVLESAEDAAGIGIVTSAQRLEGIGEGLALATIEWNARSSDKVSIEGGNSMITAACECLVEFAPQNPRVKI